MEVSHDILLEILKCLPTHDFLNFSLVCSSWRMADDFIWIHKLKIEEHVLNLKEELLNHNITNYMELYKEITDLIWDKMVHKYCKENKSILDLSLIHKLPTAIGQSSWKTGNHTFFYKIHRIIDDKFDWFTFGIADRGIVKLTPPYYKQQTYPYNQKGQYAISLHSQKFFENHIGYSLEKTDSWKTVNTQLSKFYPLIFKCELDIPNLNLKISSEEHQIFVFWKIDPPVGGFTPWLTFSSSLSKVEILRSKN